jgi:hypothetical protein
MNNRRSNENLVEELEGRQMAVATMNMPAAYRNFYRVQIAAIKQEMGRRSRAAAVARNEPRRPARAAKVIQKAFKNMYYMPNNNAIGLRGRGYRKAKARFGGRSNTENLNRNALRIARLNYNARRSNEGQGRLVEARNMANNLRMQYGENAANNALRRARNAVRRANA